MTRLARGGSEPDLIVLSEEPLNAETPLERQVGTITPTRRHYVRCHARLPRPPERLTIDGAVRSALSFTPQDLRSLPSRSLIVTLECAGNGRAYLEPPAPGEQWRLGAVATAEWTGVPLRIVLELAGPLRGAAEALFRGADRAAPEGRRPETAFERSLPLEEALGGDALLAYAMNGESLPPDHGAPVRLVVPGAYGMASVKWLERISVLDRPFKGFYQSERYVIDGAPLGPIEPRAVIVEPADGSSLPLRPVLVRGYAWSGHGAIASVDLSDDGGRSWRPARLGEDRSRHAWREWAAAYDPPEEGPVTLLARATDATGRQQPLVQVANPLGYANNAARPVRLRLGS
jgi:DMSO/TMAO reductase YedYZ molybdopterin-dependent catalytic subunit